jgi:hypothetical protein
MFFKRIFCLCFSANAGMENGVSPVYLAAQARGTSSFLMYLKGQNHEMHTFGRLNMYNEGKMEFGGGKVCA